MNIDIIMYMYIKSTYDDEYKLLIPVRRDISSI
jgi:hypothetical protein